MLRFPHPSFHHGEMLTLAISVCFSFPYIKPTFYLFEIQKLYYTILCFEIAALYLEFLLCACSDSSCTGQLVLCCKCHVQCHIPTSLGERSNESVHSTIRFITRQVRTCWLSSQIKVKTENTASLCHLQGNKFVCHILTHYISLILSITMRNLC